MIGDRLAQLLKSGLHRNCQTVKRSRTPSHLTRYFNSFSVPVNNSSPDFTAVAQTAKGWEGLEAL